MPHTHELVEALRRWMRRHHMQAFIFPSTDPHCGEYTPDHWQTRAWISGFGGSAGTAVVTMDEAALWTDSRYWLAAADVLRDGPFQLMRDGHPDTPSITDWLIGLLPPHATVGLDAWVNTLADIQRYTDIFRAHDLELCTDYDPAERLWQDRPTLPLHPVELQPEAFTGRTTTQKIALIRQQARLRSDEALLVSQLDDIAWTLNLRGTDVHRTPVFVSYLLILGEPLDGDTEAILYIDRRKLTPHVREYLREQGIEVRRYNHLELDDRWTVRYDPAHTNTGIYDRCFRSAEIQNPIPALKAVKTTQEIEGYRDAMLQEGIAMVRLMRWLVPAVEADGVTEIGVDEQLTRLRSEAPLFRDLSFDTIAGYGAHGAIVHYEATPQTDIPLEPRGFLLLDSGGQYQNGTTALTRTIPLGPLTEAERRDYTLVLKGHLRLSMARFPEGTSGTQLDVLARYAMWQDGKNYGHGTGHGIGSYLNCHEGPHQFRMNYMPAPLRAHMTVTVEPGIYIAGSHGCRTENTMLIVPDGDNEFGHWLRLEPLTLCPIPTSPIVMDLMTPDEVAYLNAYHQRVRTTLLPHLNDPADRDWLLRATEAI